MEGEGHLVIDGKVLSAVQGCGFGHMPSSSKMFEGDETVPVEQSLDYLNQSIEAGAEGSSP